MNIGGLYTYPRAVKELWDSIEIGSKIIDYSIQRGELFVVLEESVFSENKNRADLKILTIKGEVGWIAYIDKQCLVEVTHPHWTY